MDRVEEIKEVIVRYLLTPHPDLPPQGGKEINGYHAPVPSVGKDHHRGEREEDCDGLSSQERAETTVSRSTAAKENQPGFTLIELTVALLLAGIMMVGALFVYRDFMDTWDEELSRTEMQRQGTYALAVIEKTIKKAIYDDDDGGAIKFTIENTGNKITLTVPNPPPGGDGGVKDIKYYQDGTAIKGENPQVITLIPDTHVEEIEVANLTFREDTVVGGSGRSIRIDLRLTDTYGQTADFTTSVRLRNENVE